MLSAVATSGARPQPTSPTWTALTDDAVRFFPKGADTWELAGTDQQAVRAALWHNRNYRPRVDAFLDARRTVRGRATFADLAEFLGADTPHLGGAKARTITVETYLALRCPHWYCAHLPDGPNDPARPDKVADPLDLEALGDDLLTRAIADLTDTHKVNSRSQTPAPAAFETGFDSEPLDRKLLTHMAAREPDRHFANALLQVSVQPTPPTVRDLMRASMRTEMGHLPHGIRLRPFRRVWRLLLDKVFDVPQRRAYKLMRVDLVRIQEVRYQHKERTIDEVVLNTVRQGIQHHSLGGALSPPQK